MRSAVAAGDAIPIAVTGIGCRFPGGVDGPRTFWRLLREGREATPRAWLADRDRFDAAAFGISPRDAGHMHPEQRLLLEVATEALEDAGTARRPIGARTGVFVGLMHEQAVGGTGEAWDLAAEMGRARAAAAGRLSYHLDLEGPSLVVQSDRSSSLVAVHLACQSLRAGECDAALAAGVNLILDGSTSAAFARANLLAPDGRCKFGDASADGFARSEGVAVVVLKPLERALADGDPIYAVVLGGAVNHGGDRGGDLFTPSAEAQAALLRAACAGAAIAPDDVAYVEAHGTGTPLGDRTELLALGRVLGEGRPAGAPCWVGSLKGNIGHTEAAAGLAGLIKVALAIQHGEIPASLHCRTPRPDVPWDGLGLSMATTALAWPSDGSRLAGVSSFGLLGTNAHVILGPAPMGRPAAPEAPSERAQLVPLSAGSAAAARALAGRWVELLVDGAEGASLADLAHSAAARGPGRAHRIAIVARSRDELADRLGRFVAGEPGWVSEGAPGPRAPRVVFAFSGHGSQWLGMGTTLFRQERVFREALEACDGAIRRVTGWSVIDELAAAPARSRLGDHDVVQPAVFAVSAALSALWRAWGVEPAAVIGTSMGEVAAAHAAGALSLDDAARVICRRSALMMRLRGQGRMAVLQLTVEETRAALAGCEGKVSIAASNSPRSTVISGDPASVDEIVARVGGRGGFARAIRVDLASHSPLMEPLRDDLLAGLEGLSPRPACVPMRSTVTGEWVDGRALDARYWMRNLREPIALTTVMRHLCGDGYDVFLEVSPHPVLLDPLLDCLHHHERDGLVVGSLRRDADERASLLEAAGGLYARGVPLRWDALVAGARAARLPATPWDGQRFSCAGRTPTEVAASAPVPTPEAYPVATHVPRPPPLHELVQSQLRRILHLDATTPIDRTRPFRELGLTSLMTVELRSSLASALGRSFPTTLLFEHPTVDALAAFLEGDSGHRPAARDARAQAALAAPDDDPIVIVGMGCRFPGGVADPAAFWELLREGRDAITEVPPDRWDVDTFYDPDPDAPGKAVTRWGGFVDGVAAFDPGFFQVSPREARSMDPQQRLLLEVSWEALEHAGIVPERLRGSPTGVFVGMWLADYAGRALDPAAAEAHAATGNMTSIAAGRVSYALGLEGPSLVVDTACSSSLVAVHLAVESLRRGECDVALAGGVNLILAPDWTIHLSKLRALSPDGRCKTFAASANGYVRSEGCGVVVLERLSRARRRGERVWAVLRGTAINQDGHSNGLTAPNGRAQEAVIRRALTEAAVAPADVDYVECHGTGTELGDPIEVHALGAALGDGRDPAAPLLLGSVKSNIGHAEAAAGVAGLIKVALSLAHDQLPASLHVDAPNPHIAWDRLPLEVVTGSRPWRRHGRPRRAGVSSFGMSGTNAHVVVEDAPDPAPPAGPAEPPAEGTAVLVAISGLDEAALRAQAGRLAEHLRRHPTLSLLDVAATLLSARTHFTHRLAWAVPAATPLAEVAEALGRFAAGGEAPPSGLWAAAAPPGKLAVLFTGQGSQRAQMGQALDRAFPHVRRHLEEICAAFRGHLPAPLEDVLFAPPGSEAAGALHRTTFTQPALFALELALYRQWQAWGLCPDVLAGHSIGELVAAHVAGVFDLGDACRLVAARGRLMQALPGGGAMSSIEASEAEVLAALAGAGGHVALASINGPRQCVVSGDQEAVDAVARAFAARARRVTRLRVSHAFHSAHMDPMLEPFRRVVEGVALRPPALLLASGVTGRLATAAELTSADYWVAQARQPVRFCEAVRVLHAHGATTYLECGPQAVLSTLAAACLPEDASARARFVPSLARDGDEALALVKALGALHVAGHAVAAGAFLEDAGARRVVLPTYAFQHQTYWLPDPRASSSGVAAHPLLGRGTALAEGGWVFASRVASSDARGAWEHQVAGARVMPPAGFVELALAAAREVGLPTVAELALHAPLPLPAAGAVELQVTVSEPDETEGRRLTVYSRPEGASAATPFTRHATGRLGAAPAAGGSTEGLATWPPPGATPLALAGAEARLEPHGLRSGPPGRALAGVWRSGRSLFVRAVLPEALRETAPAFALHPALLEAVVDALALARAEARPAGEPLLTARSWRDVALYAVGAVEIRARLDVAMDAGDLAASLVAIDPQGELVATVASVQLEPPSASARVTASAHHLHRIDWGTIAVPPTRAPLGEVIVVGGDGALAARLGARHAADLEAIDGCPCHLVVDASIPAPGSPADAPRATARQVTHVLRRWLSDVALAAAELVIVTRGAVAAAPGDDVPAPSLAPAWGLARVARREHPDRSLRLIDVDDAVEPSLLLRALHVLVSEPELALRGASARVPRLAPAGAAAVPIRPLDPRGTVLVTGATGIGRALAEHLVRRHGARHLVLVSRRGPSTPDASALVDALRQAGAESVELAACDVADRDALAAVVARVPETRPLTAVFHLAGVLDDRLLVQVDPDSLDRVLAPKVAGACHLAEITGDRPLAAFVLFSSAAATLGTVGQASYAAANAFLDALAAHLRARGAPATSVAFGPWGAPLGMAARLRDEDRARLRRQGLLPLAPDDALALLDEALGLARAHLLPLALDVAGLARAATEGTPVPPLLRRLVPTRVLRRVAAPADSSAPPSLRDELARLPETERPRALLALVQGEAAAALGLSDAGAVPPDQPLKELGLDSVTAVHLQARLVARTRAGLPVTLAFQHPTPRAIAEHLARILGIEAGLAHTPLDEVHLSGLRDDQIADLALRRIETRRRTRRQERQR